MRRDLLKDRKACLGVEMLESRCLLSAGLRVKVSGGDLVISSKTGGQCIDIFQDGKEITVTDCGKGKFPALGRAFSGEFVTKKVRDDIRINLTGDGNEVNLTDVHVPDDLEIYIGGSSGGAGNSISLDGVDVGDDLEIGTDSEDDTIALSAVTVEDETEVDTGGGSDDVSVTDSTFKGEVKVDLGSGDDQLSVSGSTFEDEEVDVRGGKGADTVNDDCTNNYAQTPNIHNDVEDKIVDCV